LQVEWKKILAFVATVVFLSFFLSFFFFPPLTSQATDSTDEKTGKDSLGRRQEGKWIV
jgi:hypothetical protein